MEQECVVGEVPSLLAVQGVAYDSYQHLLLPAGQGGDHRHHRPAQGLQCERLADQVPHPDGGDEDEDGDRRRA